SGRRSLHSLKSPDSGRLQRPLILRVRRHDLPAQASDHADQLSAPLAVSLDPAHAALVLFEPVLLQLPVVLADRDHGRREPFLTGFITPFSASHCLTALRTCSVSEMPSRSRTACNPSI